MDATTARIPVQMRNPLDFLVDGLRVLVWQGYENGPFGVTFTWTEHEHSCGWLNHITLDGGHSYRRFDNYLVAEEGSKNMRAEFFEDDPEKLNRLQRIWIAYQRKLGETVLSV